METVSWVVSGFVNRLRSEKMISCRLLGTAESTDSGTGWGGSPVTYCLVTLGPLYHLYLSNLCIFCSNSINILAGVNGVEVGQSLVIAVASVLHNLIQYRLDESVVHLQPSSGNGGGAALGSALTMEERQHETVHRLYALILLGPFIGVSMGLWRFNRYPSRVFVGDSYTYFAGTVLAVAGITGLYSKTLMLFFLPQLFNFFISLPQLFGFVHCPPHRVPHWNPKTNKLRSSGNFTLLNVFLWVAGRELNEGTLASITLWVQAAMCGVGFVIRFFGASRVYDHVE